MDRTRFDRLTKGLAGHFTRRAVVHGGGVALAAGAAGAIAPRRLGAQEASPAATPDDAVFDGPEDTTFMFIQVATGGTWAPKAGVEGTYTLTLNQPGGQTVYFSDRPERIAGVVPTRQFLEELGFTPANPPNAAVVAGEDVLVVELLNPMYDAAAGTLTYDAVPLAVDDAGEGLAQLAAQQGDGGLPADLGPVSLFIDDCPDLTQCVVLSSPQGPLPGAPAGQCWDWNKIRCMPCNGNTHRDYNQICNDNVRGCNGLCVAR